jgi:hypothetical protein
VIENDSVFGGGEGVTEYERHGLIVSVLDELLPEKASSPLVDGLFDAGRSGRDAPVLPGASTLYPSHFTRLMLSQSQTVGILADRCLQEHAPAGLAAIACRPFSDHTFSLCWDAMV